MSDQRDGDELVGGERLSLIESGLVDDQRAKCEVCAEPIGWDGVSLMAWEQSEAIDAWGFCQACYQLLRETIRVEVGYGPGTPPPKAWSRVRKLRAERERRWRRERR